MTRAPSPKEDALRAMREATFAESVQPRDASRRLRKAIDIMAGIPAKKPKKAKRKGRR